MGPGQPHNNGSQRLVHREQWFAEAVGRGREKTEAKGREKGDQRGETEAEEEGRLESRGRGRGGGLWLWG